MDFELDRDLDGEDTVHSLRFGNSIGLIGLLALTQVVVTAYPVLAQEDDASVPQALVRAILARPGENPLVLPGLMPDTVAATVRFPSGWQVLGSVQYESSASVYVAVQGTPDFVREFLQGQLHGMGWTSPDPIRRGGFVPSASSSRVILCGPHGELITLRTLEQPDGVLLSLGFQEQTEASPCDRREESSSAFSETNDHMPVLSIPEGDVRSTGMGGGGSNSAFSAIELVTTLAPTEIADHVGADLAASGWTLDAAAAGDVSLLRTWTREFDDGFRAHAQLLVITLGSGKYDVTFQLTKMSER